VKSSERRVPVNWLLLRSRLLRFIGGVEEIEERGEEREEEAVRGKEVKEEREEEE
jgi:hypothetical protein